MSRDESTWQVGLQSASALSDIVDRSSLDAISGGLPMRRLGQLLSIAVLFIVGCTYAQLQRSTINQAGTLSDLQCQQVMDNLAMFAHNPEALPHFALTTTGTAQITDTGSTSNLLASNFIAEGLWSNQFTLGGSRAVQEAWTLLPLTDPDKLGRMKCAYQYAFRYVAHEDPDCRVQLAKFFCPDKCKDVTGDSPHLSSKCEECLDRALPSGFRGRGSETG
jgi:hypothetical protein